MTEFLIILGPWYAIPMILTGVHIFILEQQTKESNDPPLTPHDLYTRLAKLLHVGKAVRSKDARRMVRVSTQLTTGNMIFLHDF